MKKLSKLLLSATAFLSIAGAVVLGAPNTAYAYDFGDVSNLQQTSATKNSITVTWEGQNCSTYNIYYREYSSSDSTDKLFKSVDGSATTCTITGLKTGTKYIIEVEGIDSESYSDIDSIYDACTIVDKVKGLKQDTWYHWIEDASVTWERLTAADEYEYIFKNGKGKKVKSGKTTSCGLSFSVKNNQVFTFQVRPIQKRDKKTVKGAWNTIKVFEQPWITKGSLKNKVLSVKWDKQIGAVGYDIYVSTNNKDYKKVKSVGKSTTSLKIKKFKKKKLTKKKYYVYVVSKTKLDGKVCKSGKVYTFKVDKNGCTDGYIG